MKQKRLSFNRFQKLVYDVCMGEKCKRKKALAELKVYNIGYLYIRDLDMKIIDILIKDTRKLWLKLKIYNN